MTAILTVIIEFTMKVITRILNSHFAKKFLIRDSEIILLYFTDYMFRVFKRTVQALVDIYIYMHNMVIFRVYVRLQDNIAKNPKLWVCKRYCFPSKPKINKTVQKPLVTFPIGFPTTFYVTIIIFFFYKLIYSDELYLYYDTNTLWI